MNSDLHSQCGGAIRSATIEHGGRMSRLARVEDAWNEQGFSRFIGASRIRSLT